MASCGSRKRFRVEGNEQALPSSTWTQFNTTGGNMIKLMSIFAASALALFLSGVAFAADEKMQDRPADTKMQDPTGVPTMRDLGGTPVEQTKQDQEYLATLKKCEVMQDAAKQRCIDQARQKYNRM
jgi:hypothetical protein